MKARALRFFSFVVVIVLASRAGAAPRDPDQQSAQQHFDAGRAQVRAGRCDLAVEEFRRSIDAAPNVGAWLNLGDCLEGLGRLQDAYDAFRAAQSLAAERRDDRLSLARGSAERVESKVVRLVLTVPADVAGVVVKVDGAPVPHERWSAVFVAPGDLHTVEAHATGRAPFSRRVTGRAGEAVPVDVALGPEAAVQPRRDALALAPEPASSEPFPLRTAGLVMGGVGAASVVAGGVLGVLALSARSDLARTIGGDPRCSGGYPNGSCDPSARGELDPIEERARGRATASTVLFIAGAALLGAGLVLYLVSPSSAASKTGIRVAPRAGAMSDVGFAF